MQIALGESLINMLLSINFGCHVYHHPCKRISNLELLDAISNGKFKFYFALQLSHKLYALTDNVSKTLQSYKMSALSGKRNAELTNKTIETMRNDESFVLFYDATVRKAEKQNQIIQ